MSVPKVERTRTAKKRKTKKLMEEINRTGRTKTCKTSKHIEKITQDRRKWKSFVDDICPDRG